VNWSQDFDRLIAARDTKGIMDLMFTYPPFEPCYGFSKEDEFWDYKVDVPSPHKGHEAEWAAIAADVLAFHNSRGGVLFFGVHDKTFSLVGATHFLDQKLFNDKLRRYVGDRFWVSFSRELKQADQRYLGVAIIPARSHATLRAMASSPLKDGKQYLKVGDLCIRVGDETRILRGSSAVEYESKHHISANSSTYFINESNYRIFRPDYRNFVLRKDLCAALDKAVSSERTYVASLSGIGGIGKTALAVWATLKAYDRRQFDFIVSLTAKDRALTSAGIVPLTPTLTSLSDLLGEICDVTGFSELLDITDTNEQLASVKKLILSQFKGLLLVDNLETVDDPRIIDFLEDLPVPTKAIVTSRRARVRVATQPIDVGPFQIDEAVQFLDEQAKSVKKHFFGDMSRAEKVRIADSCDRIPLVMEWFIGRSRDAQRSILDADALVSQSKHGDELVEFSFRRVYSELTDRQQNILKVLSLIGRALPVEAIAAGADLPIHIVADELEEMKDYSLVERQFDVSYRDIVHSLLPVTTTFVYREIKKVPGYETAVRHRLNDWYQAKEIHDPAQRILVQQVRRGERNPELALLHVANNFVANKDLDNAEQYFKLGLERNPISWQIHLAAAVFYEEYRDEMAMALRHYQLAADHGPRQGPDRARIFKRHGMLLRQSGTPSAYRDAAQKLEIALAQTPNDHFCRHALGDCYVKLGAFQPALEILKPLETHSSPETRAITYPLLEHCLKELNENLALAQIRQKMVAEKIIPKPPRQLKLRNTQPKR